MRKVTLFMGVSLDGYAAAGWLPPTQNEVHAEEHRREMMRVIDSVDTLLMGRVTYELWRRFWPTRATSSSELEATFSRFAERTEKVVFSTTLDSVDWTHARLAGRDLAEEIATLRRSPGKGIAIVGGGKLAHALGALGLIDECHVWIHPVLLGAGTTLLAAPTSPASVRVIDVKLLASGVTRLHFQPTA